MVERVILPAFPFVTAMHISITSHDLALIGILTFLEGILSVDNALVLAILARHLPKEQQKKALTYGLFGAFAFRLIALLLVSTLVKWTWVKFVGGGYLIFLAVKHLFFVSPAEPEPSESTKAKAAGASFWKTVVMIELTDIAFAADSILAAVAMTNKLWVVYIGGVLGIVCMRLAASQFIRLLEKFPRLERTAYLLILVIGIKVVIEGLQLPDVDFHSPSEKAFWIFWSIMGLCMGYGFLPSNGAKKSEGA